MIVWCDGAARGNPGPAGIGVVLRDADGNDVERLGLGIGPATNNVAEYRACLEGLRLAAKHGARRVLVRSDSRLLVEQLSGRFRVKNPTLLRLHGEVRTLVRGFDEVTFEHVPRSENTEADALANRGVDEWLAVEGRRYEPAEPPPPLFDD